MYYGIKESELIEIPEDEAIKYGHGIYEYQGYFYKFIRCNIKAKTFVCNLINKPHYIK